MRRRDREVTEKNDIESIISRADVCRLAFAVNDTPYIVTLNFGYSPDENCFWFHCASEGRKLEMMKKNNYVCFEIDTDHHLISGNEACEFTMNFSSIVGYGFLTEVISIDQKINGLTHIMEHYSDRSSFEFNERMLEKTTLLKLEISTISCKRKI
jgi:nitroimidazol reductase NimA-like FMN-containing flavoprotein (pyridoxamine 5'-phosphate oxidase superfamily)